MPPGALIAAAAIVATLTLTVADRDAERDERLAPEPFEARGGLAWMPSAPAAPSAQRQGWRRHVLLPRSRTVCPPRVALPSQEPSVRGARSLSCSGGGVASLDTGARVILDFGREMSGRLRMRLASAERDARLEVAFSETLEHLDADCDELGIEGVARDGGIPLPPCPRVVTAGATSATWEDTAPRSGFRYVLLTAHGRVDVEHVETVDYQALPNLPGLERRKAYEGWFLSSDDALNRIWYAGAYNAQINTLAAGRAGILSEGIRGLPSRMTVMVDGAKRDRYVWYDLTGPKQLIPLLLGDRETPRNTITVLARSPTSDGFVPACRPPGGFYGASCELPITWTDATPWWVVALGEQWLWTGDRALVRRLYPRVEEALGALETCMTGDGVLAPCHGAYTYEYGDPTDAGDRSPTAYLNVLAVRAFRQGAHLARVAGAKPDARRFRRLARGLREALDDVFWDDAIGAYHQSIDNPDNHPQDANVLAALWHVASPRRARRALRYVKRELWTPYGVRGGNAGTWGGEPVENLIAHWISYFELQARLDRGAAADARRMIDAGWGHMHLRWKPIRGPHGITREPPSTTGWEHVNGDGSLFRGADGSSAHVWSAGATVALTTGFAGLSPTAPGFRRWRLDPAIRDSGLRWTRAQLPALAGAFRTAWRISGPMSDPRLIRMRIRAPAGTTGVAAVPLLGRRRVVSMNGRVVWDGRRPRGANARRRGDEIVIGGLRGTVHLAARRVG